MKITRKVSAAGAIAVLALVGCGSSAAKHPAAATRPATTSPADSAASVQAQAPSGPFKIVSLYCGKFSKAQVNTYADFSGYIFRYTNISNSVVGSPNLTVNFVKGSTVTGSNVNGSSPSVAPGQSATADVGAVGGLGNTLKFTQCEPLDYGVITATGGGQTGTFTVPPVLAMNATVHHRPKPSAATPAPVASAPPSSPVALPPGVTPGPARGEYYVNCFQTQCTSAPGAGPFGTTCTWPPTTGEQLCR